MAMTEKLGLYRFQQEAIDKLGTPRTPNVLIGDDMGTGKTVMAIALDKVRRETDLPEAQLKWLNGCRKMTLIVVPKSTLGGWKEHLEAWAPELSCIVIDTTNRSPFVEAVLSRSHDVYICHWDALRLEPKICWTPWLHVVADEVHRAKNSKTQQTRGLLNLRTIYKTAMSGTWADNSPVDAWQVLNWLYPKTWRSKKQFVDYHVKYKHHNMGYCMAEDCNKQHRTAYKEIVGVHDAALIQRQIKPFYIRRTKDEVLPDLPDKQWTRIGVDLHPKQRRAYDDMRRKMLAWVGENEGQPIAAPVVISQLISLQQFAVAYGEVVRGTKRVQDPETKAWRTVEADILRLTEPSAKLDTCMELIDSASKSQRLVFFGQSKQVMYLFKDRLEKAGVSYAMVTGDQTQNMRNRAVSDFQEGNRRVFLGTIQAGGEGITLTRASAVVFLDRNWSPSKNRQAEDRAHRIGQRESVQIIDLVARDTIDMGRLQKLELKWDWLRQILGDKRGDK
jgi:SNF2 family DNA or RNA helicase